MIGTALSKLFRICLAATLALALSAASIADTLYLKDGRVLEGRVDREGDDFVFFVIKIGSLETAQLFSKDDVLRIEYSEEKKEAAVRAPADRGRAPRGVEREAIPDGATRIAFITLEEMVGPFFNADALKRSVELLDGHDVDIVVLQINSGGGAAVEVEKLSDVIQYDIKPKYRVVGWIDSAISAAAMTVWTCEEIYMMPHASVGGATMFMQQGGGAVAADGEALQWALDIGKMLSERGRRDPKIMRAMQVFMTLSCDIDENGRVTWHDNDKGRFIVSPQNRILTLNSQDAARYGVINGVAATKDELARLLGATEWAEVAPEADRYQREFRENVATAQVRISELLQRMQISLQYGQIGRARQMLGEVRSQVRRAPSLEFYFGLTNEWFREREEEIRRLQRQQQERDAQRRGR